MGTTWGKTFTWETNEKKNITKGNERSCELTKLSLAGLSGEQMGRERKTVLTYSNSGKEQFGGILVFKTRVKLTMGWEIPGGSPL